MKKIILTLILLAGISTYSQDKIVYDVQTNNYKLYDKGNKEYLKAILDKNTEYEVYIKNYNPFLYSNTMTITQKDGVKEFILFISSALGIKPGITLPAGLGEIEFTSLITKTPTDSVDFNKNKDVDDFLKKYYNDLVNCQLLRKQFLTNADLNLFKQDNMLKEYYDIIVRINNIKIKDPKDTTAAVILAVLPTETQVKSLDTQISRIIDFNNVLVPNYGYKLNTFKSNKNTEIMAEVTLIPRAEFKNDFDEIKSKKTYKVKSAVNFGYSSGLMGAWNIKKQYYTKKRDDGKYIINEETSRNFMPGIMALGHLFFGNQEDFGIALGAGIDIEASPNLLCGFTYNIFHSNVLINAGYGFSYQDKISDAYDLNKAYDAEPTVKTKNVLQGGCWLGLSYKF